MKTFLQKAFIFSFLLFTFSFGYGQIPAGYYNNSAGKTGDVLRAALCTITTSGHVKLSYTPGVWNAYAYTDVLRPGSDTIWDMYSDIPNGTPAYYYILNTGQCGTSAKEGDCYSREHCLPNSCWGGITTDYQYSDMHHLFPCDQYVNAQKSNYMIGETVAPNYISTNGSKVGPCSYPGYTDKVFEPIDAYKGDFARAWLYLATRYMNSMPNWVPSTGTAAMWSLVYNSTTNNYQSWVINMLLDWCTLDPVSQKEIDRNNAIYYNSGQHNRNPYVDHPEYVCLVWGTSCISAPAITNITISPANPTVNDPVNVSAGITDNGSISTAILYWDITPGTFSNSIAMLAGTPPTFTTSDTIPRQDAGTTVYYRIVATDNEGHSTTSDVFTYNIPKGEPTNHPTGFTCGTTTSSSISLTWTDAVGAILPTGYLIKMSPISLSDITYPSDGIPVADGTNSKNILQGVQAFTFTGLTSSTSYYFKIYAYSNTGSNINYKLIGTIQSTSCSTSASGGSYVCLTEGFDSAPTAPAGWTFTNIGTTYISSGNYGVASPSLKFDASGDRIVTPLLNNPTELKFWIKGQTATGSYLLVEGYNGSWVQIDNILMTGINSGTTRIYNASSTPTLTHGFTQFRFTYTKSLSNIAFDDISITCGGCTAPSNQSGGMLFNSIGPNSMIVKWTRGNGNNVLVIAKAGSAVNADPVSGTSYIDSDIFGSGDVIGTGNFVIYNGPATSVEVTGLLSNTRYYFAVYEYNNIENCYKTPGLTGNEITSAPVIIPTLTTTTVSSITINSATSGGNISLDGGSPIIDRGVCWNTVSGPTIADSKISNGTGSGSYTSNISGLTGGATYYVRAYATNTNGTAYGNEEVFITLKAEPSSNPTAFTCGTTTTTTIPISWTAATGTTLPNGYLIKVSPSGISNIVNPVDGVPEADGIWVQNVLFGTNNFTFTGLNTNTTYYYKIFSYSNSNLDINYKTDGTIPSTSCTTLNVPSTIVYQGFETMPQDTWNYTGGIKSSAKKFIGTYSGKLTSGQTMTFAIISIASYSNVNLSIAFSGINVRTNENLYLEISYDNGISWTGAGSVMLVNCNQSGGGYSSARSVAFGATSSNGPITVSTNPWIVGIPASSYQIAIRLRCPTMNSSSAYYVDDIKLSGLLSCTTPAAYNVTGGGSYCSGDAGVAIGLSNSETGVNYQLYRDVTIPIGIPIAGTGSAITFGNQTTEGLYTVEATNASALCTNTMNGSASVSINTLPVASFSYTGSPYNPTGTALPTLNGTSGVFSASPVGLVFLNATTGEVDLSASTTGTYTVTNTIAASGGCAEVMATSSISIAIPTNKMLTLKAFIEGLYIGGGYMHEAVDYNPVNEDFSMKWGASIADTMTVVLYDGTYSNVIARYSGIFINTDGTMTISVNSSLSDSYFITIFPRNSVPITTAAPQSFTGLSISYDFTYPIDQAYGTGLAPQKDLGDGFFGMYSGELDNDSYYAIDGSDVSILDPDIVNGPYGYFETDLNGDGIVDGSDMTIMDANSIFGPIYWNPLIAKIHTIINK